jgi:hypothetical protein
MLKIRGPKAAAKGGVEAGTCRANRPASYQLQQYIISPRRNDPYFPGHRDHGDAAAKLAELDVMLSSFKEGGTTSRL